MNRMARLIPVVNEDKLLSEDKSLDECFKNFGYDENSELESSSRIDLPTRIIKSVTLDQNTMSRGKKK
jgi:hypothetical protein